MMKQIEGDTGSLTGAATFQRVIIEEGSELLVSGEDLTSAFYLFRLPPQWVNYLLLEKPVSKRDIGLKGTGRCYLGLTVLPMGWHSSVGLMQAAHRRLALSSPLNGGAGLHELAEISRRSEFPELDDHAGWSVYLDDTTILEQVASNVAESLKGKPPPEQEQLKRAYAWWGIPTNDKKSLVRESKAERLGAMIDGKTGGTPDASETGGGLCYASRLTMAGLREAEELLEGKWDGLPKEDPPDELPSEEKVLVIDLFAGIGGLGEALRKAGLTWRHLVAVEQDSNCRRLLRRAHPGCELVNDIRAFDEGALRKAIEKVPGLTGIVAGGGSPCQGLSTLSSERKHLADERSALFYEAVRVLDMIKKVASELDVWAVRFIENVVADDDDIEEMSAKLKMEPVMVDACHLSRARRPRLFWLSVELTAEEDVDSILRPHFVEKVYRSSVLEEEKDFLIAGAKWEAGQENNKLKFPTMTRAIPRSRPPPKPAGLESTDEEARKRWEGDRFRFPPYTYKSAFMIRDEGSDLLRPLQASEREILMGFPKGHTEKLLKKKPTTVDELLQADDLRCAAIGNSFHTNAVGCLFDHCFSSMGLKERKGATKIVQEYLTKLRDGIKEEIEVAAEDEPEQGEDVPEARGLDDDETMSIVGAMHCEALEQEAQQQQLLDDTVRSDAKLRKALVAAFIRRQEFRGSDVRLDLGSLYRPDSFPRGSVQVNRWKWHVATSYPFRVSEHINSLELRALVHGLEWRCRRAHFGDCRALHLTDSQVALAVAVKGRSSSRLLNRLLKRYAALQVAAGLQRERRKLGALRHQVVAAKTEERYIACFENFLKFHRLQKSFTLPSFEAFDDMVAEYIESLWDQGEPKSCANYTLAALQFYRPQLKHHLPWSWKLVKVWNTLELPQRATPLSPELLMALSGQALRWHQPTFAWLLVIGFTLFLRTGELLSIQVKDVVITHAGGVLYLPPSKGGKRNLLPLERVEICEKSTIHAFNQLLRNKSPGDYLWDQSRGQFMSLWHSIIDSLKLDGLQYFPYSLRRGGATSAYKAGSSLDQLVSRGRWAHVQTARLYLDTGMQALAAISLPATAHPLLHRATAAYLAANQVGTRGRAVSQLRGRLL
eukprot:Skav213268  [mRNA]  locus=scaffold2944:31681:35312:+ [translate_table: standard]